MLFGRLFAGLAVAASVAFPGLAQQSEVLFQHKHWKVDIHAWDDGDIACRAMVGSDAENFGIWVFQDSAIQLQFFSTAWEFGSGQTADLQVQIDKKPKWDLTNARLSQNSVQFTLPDSDAAVDFVMEIAAGNTLFLRAKDGRDVQNYSLAGSRASIDALIECGGTITQGSPTAPSNPFN